MYIYNYVFDNLQIMDDPYLVIITMLKLISKNSNSFTFQSYCNGH